MMLMAAGQSQKCRYIRCEERYFLPRLRHTVRFPLIAIMSIWQHGGWFFSALAKNNQGKLLSFFELRGI